MKKLWIIIIAAVVSLLITGVAVYFYLDLQKQKADNIDLKELAELNKKEMENEYVQFALQYDELKTSIKDDSLMTQLNKEQQRAQRLLAELKQVKSDNAAEITRLKKELETVRAVLRSYIIQVDSLSRLNQALQNENQDVKQRLGSAQSEISNLSTEKRTLTERVAIAAQLDATAISLLPQDKKGKDVKKVKDIARFVVAFTVVKNITAKTGERTIYVRLVKPTNEVISQTGVISYENRSIGYSAQKTIEYTGEEQRVTMYIPIDEFLSAGTYSLYLFADGTMIGSGSISITK